jgi:hypothetical protein
MGRRKKNKPIERKQRVIARRKNFLRKKKLNN